MIEVMFFGQLTDHTGTSHLLVDDIQDTDALISMLKEKYPALSNAKYMIAVDNRMVTVNTAISSVAKVALMPPFSGG